MSLDDTSPHGLDLLLSFIDIDHLKPVAGVLDRPCLHWDRSRRPVAAPTPLFCPGDKSRSYGIPLNGATDREQILAGVHRKGFEATLIDMALAHTVPMLMPALSMGEGQPIHEPGQIPVLPRPDNEMPGIRHHTIRQQAHRGAGAGFHKYPLEGCIIVIVLEEDSSGARPIQYRIAPPTAVRNGRPMSFLTCPDSVQANKGC